MITEDFPVCLKYTGLSEKETQMISAHGNPFLLLCVQAILWGGNDAFTS